MFKIEKANFATNHEIVTLINEVKNIKASVIPSLGGMLNGFKKQGFEIIDGIELSRYGVADYLGTFKSAVLLPYPNRISNGRFEFQGNQHQMNCNESALNNSLHGFIYDKPFKIVEQEVKDEEVSISLKFDYLGDIEGFPYPFTTTLIYKLSVSGKLYIECAIENTGSEVLPLGLGWHSYFDLGQKVDGLSLKFNTTTHWEVDEEMIPTTDTVEIDPISGSIGADEYDGCFTLESPIVELAIPGGNKLILDCGKDFPYLQVYTPPHRNSIAIEPMTCLPDVYNNGVGLIELTQGDKKRFTYSMIIE